MVARLMGRISALLIGAFFAEAARINPSEPRRSRRYSRRIVKNLQSPALADLLPAQVLAAAPPSFSSSGS